MRRWRIRSAQAAWQHPGFAQARLVTLDVFDTALRRSVQRPVDVFMLAAWRLQQRGMALLDPEVFTAERIRAETEARAIAFAAGRHEVTLSEIYAQLGGHSHCLRELEAEELATERDVLFANPDVLALYRALQAKGTPVAFISDIYLGSGMLEELLRNSGYDGAHRVFCSADHGVDKARGGLFPLVAASLAVRPDDIWHIGDNPRADVLRARQAGFNALWYLPLLPRPAKLSGPRGAEARIVGSLLAGIPALLANPADDAVAPDEAVWRRIGREVAGPLYLGFALWLEERIAQSKPDRVVFCARDGMIVRAIYHLVLAARAKAANGTGGSGGPEADVPDTYLMVSRRALVFPLLDRIDGAALDFLCGPYGSFTVEELIARIGLRPEDCAAALRAGQLSLSDRADTAQNVSAIQALLKRLEPEILAIAGRERRLLERYFMQEGLGGDIRVAFVDVGWKGSLQQAAARLLGPCTRLDGYYFGTTDAAHGLSADAGATTGWFIDLGEPAARNRFVKSQTAILELLFAAPHGSVLGYVECNGKVEAVLQDASDPMALHYAEAARHIQSAAKMFVDLYLSAFGTSRPCLFDVADILPAFERLVRAPREDEAAAIGNLFHIDGFGSTRTGQFIARPPTAIETLLSPGRAAAGYRQATWRRGFLVRLLKSPFAAGLAIKALGLIRPGMREF